MGEGQQTSKPDLTTGTAAVGQPTGSPKSIFDRFWAVLRDLFWGHWEDLGDLNGGSR